MILCCPHCDYAGDFPHILSARVPWLSFTVVWMATERVRCPGCKKIVDEDDLMEELDE